MICEARTCLIFPLVLALPQRTRSIYEESEIIYHKEIIITPITLQRSQAEISRALLRDS